MPITEDDLQNWFTYHRPALHEHVLAYEAIREYGLIFARIIMERTPPSADQTAAIRKVREAVMTANAAIACGGR